MIPQITEINFPSYATLNSATITLSEMGDRNITTQIKIDGDIVPDFSGWELEFKGERFILPVKEPQAAKDNTSRRSIVDLTFSSWAVQEMKRYFFVEMTSIESGTAIADKYKASLGLNIENFVTAFNNVLNYYFNGNIEMDLFGSGTGIYSAEPAFFEIDYTHIWDVLQKIYEIYQVRWTITYDSTTEKYVIKVGYPAAEIDDHEFEYGYEGGLLRFERQVQDYDITNILLGRGGEKNLPYRYFKKVDPQNPNWAADPDAIPELKNIYFENLRDINFRRYVQGWKTNPNRILEEGDVVEAYDSARGETDFAYAKGHTDERFNPVEYVKDDASIAVYGERWGALENADDIYPTIQGIEVDPYGRIDQVVDVEPVTTDDIEAMAADAAEVTNVAGASRTEWINYNSTLELDINGADFSVPEGKVGNLTIQNTWFDTILYAKRGNDQVNVDPADAVHELVAINTTLSYVTVVDRNTGTELPPAGIPAGNYFYKLHIVVKAEFESSMYNSVNVTVGVNGMKLTTSEGSANAWKPTFDIWVKNIWNTTQQSGESDEQYAARVWEPILGDRTGEEAKVAFSTGFLSLSEDYNFTIASIPVVDRTKTIDGVASEWRITLIKSDAEYEATGKYIPNAETGGNASAGDYFFFTGIDMPWAYVLWAEEKLNAYKETELAKLKQINPTWIIRIDKVRANTKLQGELEYLADRFASGAKLKVKDKRFTNGQVLTLYVQTVTYTWQEPSSGNPYLVPDIEVVLSDKIEVSADPVTQLEGDVQNIQSTYAKISDIESAIRRVASPIFLKKTGESERSLSPTRFSSLMASESFRQGDIGGQGWGAYTDGEGHSVLEADTIVVRKDMRVNTLTINQIAYLGGKQIISAAAMECTKVDDTDSGYVCYFDQKQGSVANLFKVDDIVLGQVWNADESEQRYYKRKVIAVSTDSITLSKDIADGDGVPQPKDIMVQYGSYSDTSRQYVIVRDVIGGGYERMLSGLTTVYANGDEYYFAGRQSGSTPRWFVGDANGQHASYQNGVLNITGRLSVTTQVDKGNGTYESLSNYLSNLQDQIDGNIQTWYATGVPTLQNYPASTWPTVEDKNNHIGDLYYESETGKAYRFMLDGNTYKWIPIADEDIAAALALAQQNQTAIAGLAYLKAATNQGTLVQGGLVLTSMIQLGQTEEGTYKVYSGINGIMDTSALGNGIAAWYGGPMADKGADSTLTDFAKSLFRFDGSGYLASGNIKWDLNGNGEIPGISWNNGRITLSPDIYLQGGDRLTQIVDAVNRMYTQFAYDSHDNITVAPTHALYIPTTSPAYPIEGKVALYYDYNGNYSELPSGGVANIYDLTIRKNGTSLGTYNLGEEAADINIPVSWADLTENSTHRFLTDTMISTWNAKQDAISDLATIRAGAALGNTALQSETDPTVSAWAKKTSLAASDVPTLAISKISGLQDALDGKQPLDTDLTAIAALTGSGLLRRNSNNTWSLDTNTYLTSSDHKALTLKVGAITIGSDYTSLAAKTYTITKANITDTIGSTTYAPYNANGYVPTTRKVNGHALSADVTVSKGDVGLGNVENTALSTWAGTSNITTLGTITTGVWHGTAIANSYLANSSVTINSKSLSLGGSLTLKLSDLTDDILSGHYLPLSGGTLTGALTGPTASFSEVVASSKLAVPTSAPSSPDSSKVYLYASSLGEYSETPGGGGGGDGETLTVTKNGSAWLSYNGSQAVSLNLVVPTALSDLTADSTHRLVTDTQINTWSAKMSKMQAIPYIEGPTTDTTAGHWTGTYEGITALEEGLTIIYVPHVAGASTTTLNINGLGAKTCYWTGTSKLTTHYPVGTPILFTYYNNGWRRADMNPAYSAGTKALFDAGENTANRVWSANVLAESVAPIVHTHDWSDITGAPDFITEAALAGYATEQYVDEEITALNLGTASQKDAVSSITSGGAGLPTAGAIYTFVNNAVTAAQPYKGVSSTEITDGGTEMPTISGYTTRTKGDVVAYNKKEFIWEGDKWRELGDEGSYALKTVQVIAGTGLAGGGAISQDVTLSLSSAAQASLALADSALQSSDLDGYVNAISQTSGNYVTGITKSGKTLTITRGTLPTTIALSNVTGADDLKAIEALTGTSGFLKKTAANTWTLDTNTYLTSASHKALTLKVGSITIGSDYNSLAAKTYTITKANLTDTIGTTTYAPYNSAGYLPLSGGTLTGALIGTTITTSGDVQVDGDFHADGNIESDSNVLGYGVRASALLAIPTAAPTAIVSGEVYLWADEDGNYAETASGGVAAVYDLTIRKNGTAIGTYNLGTQAADVNIPVGWSDLTPDASHRFLTDSLISTWNGKQDSISDLATIRSNASHGNTAYGWGNHASAGYLTEHQSLANYYTKSEVDTKTAKTTAREDSKLLYNGQTVDTGLSGLGISTATNLLNNGYHIAIRSNDSNPFFGLKQGTNLWYAQASSGYFYFGPTSAKALRLDQSGNGVFQTGSVTATKIIKSGGTSSQFLKADGSVDSNTYLTSFTETDPTVPSWAKASSKPTYTLDEVADGSTRKLSNYLPLTGGTLTGNLTTLNILAGSAYTTVGTLAAPFNSFYSGNYNGVGQFGAVMVVDNTSYSVINATTSFLLIGRGYNASGLAKGTTICGNYIGFEVGNLGGVVTINSNGYITPNANGSYDFGGATRRWRTVYANTLNAATGITTAGTLSVTGESTFTGNLLPKTTNATDIGSSSKKFKDIYSIGTIYADGSLSIPTAAPSNPVSTKAYLWIDTNGNYAELPNS